MLDCEQSEWSLSSVQAPPPQKNFQDEESSFAHTTLHQEYSYETKNPPQNKPTILPDATLNSVGKIMSVVEDFVVIDSLGQKVVNLETYLINKNRQIVGYIVDVFGPVEHHYYALKQEDNHVEVGEELFYVEGCNILKKQDIQKLMEVGKQKDQDSDDEQVEQRVFKKRDRDAVDEVKEQKGRKFKMPNHKNDRKHQPYHQQQQQQQQHHQQQQTFNQQSFWSPNNYPQQPMFSPQQPQFNSPNGFFNQATTPNQYLHGSMFGNPTASPNQNLNNQYPNNNMYTNFSNPQMTGNVPNPQLNIQPNYSMNHQQGMLSQNPEQLRRLGEYYQNCYQQMMFNQKK